MTWAQRSHAASKGWVREGDSQHFPEASVDAGASSREAPGLHQMNRHQQDEGEGAAATEEEPFGRLGWQKASRTKGHRRQS